MKTNIMTVLCLSGALLFSGFSFTSCLKGDDISTNQFSEGIRLNVFGPSPVARGGELRFLGSGMDQVTAVSIPGCEDITDINIISPKEIRVTVPQEALPGQVLLRTPKGDITTKTELTFTEPISIESISPLSIVPGNELTISGEYLNLINQVIFTEDVVVPAEDFITHDRKTIKIIVPEEAQTGQVALSDGAELPNLIYSEEDLAVALPSFDQISNLTEKLPGDEIIIAGNNLQLVKSVIVPCYPDNSEVEFTVESGQLKFSLPENAADGEIEVVPASGIHVSVAVLNMATPEVTAITPSTEIKAGDEIVISGKKLDVVSTLSFPGIEEPVQPVEQSATQLKVVMPAKGQSGNLIFNTKSGKTIDAGIIETLKPINLSFNGDVKACEDATIVGSNLDLVSDVVFTGDLKGKIVSQSGSQLVVEVPALAQSGNIVLNMTNGEQVSIPNVTVTSPDACYITSSLLEKYTAGEIMTVEIAKSELLTAVNINDNPVQYILKGNELMIMVPENYGSSSTLKLISGSNSVEYTVVFVPAEKPETVIWEGSFSPGSWGAANQDLAYGNFDWSTVQPGTEITVYYTLDSSSAYWQLRLGDGSWSALPTIPDVNLSAGSTSYTVTLSQEVLDVLLSNNGMIVTGCFFTMTKITLK